MEIMGGSWSLLISAYQQYINLVNQTHTKDLGTLNYIAIEVLSGKYYDTKADIFSLGFVMQNIFNININE